MDPLSKKIISIYEKVAEEIGKEGLLEIIEAAHLEAYGEKFDPGTDAAECTLGPFCAPACHVAYETCRLYPCVG